MSYIGQTLLSSEVIIYRARLHWYRYLESWAAAFAGLAMMYLAFKPPLFLDVIYDVPMPVGVLGALLVVAAFPI